jgi:hypothetical protein
MVSDIDSPKPAKSLLPSIAALLIFLAVLFAAYFYGKMRASRGLLPGFESQAAKERLVAAMQFQLQVAAEAEKNAVMADTDESSDAFAQESRHASEAVEKARQELGRLIEADGRQDEVARFTEFSDAWKHHQQLDQEILALAVENTNLKAMELSFGPAGERLRKMESALDAVVEQSASSADASVIERAAWEALIAALKIHALHGRHIAESHDAVMDRIEAEMKSLDSEAREGLSTVAAEAGEPLQPSVDKARTAYADFQKINSQILELSRRNSNVRSAAISLGEKRQVTAQCRKLLSALQESIQPDILSATR